MSRSVKAYVSSCGTCQRTKPSQSLRPGLLQPLPIASQPWAQVRMDLITDLPPSGGFASIVVFVDALGAHWLRRAAAFWSRMVYADPNSLMHRAFRDNLSLQGEGGDCWSAQMLPHFVRFEAISSPPPSPLWAAPASLPEAQLLEHNHAF